MIFKVYVEGLGRKGEVRVIRRKCVVVRNEDGVFIVFRIILSWVLRFLLIKMERKVGREIFSFGYVSLWFL